MSLAMMAHLGYVPPQLIQIDPSLLAMSQCIDPAPSYAPPGPREKAKRKADARADDTAENKVKKPRKKPVRTPRPTSSRSTSGEAIEGFFPIGALAAANTLGRYTKLASKCSRHTKTPKSTSTVEIDLHRLTRLVKVLSAKCAARETALAAQQGRPPRPVPTIDDVPIAPLPVPSRRKLKKAAVETADEPRGDIAVDLQAYTDYFDRNAAQQQESVLDDAQALLSLADADPGTLTAGATTTRGSGTSFAVGDEAPGEGVGLEISAAAALAAAQAARQPLPFSQPTKSFGAGLSSRRPVLPRAATTSTVRRGAGGGSTLPTLQTLAALSVVDNGAPTPTSDIEAYRSLPPPPMGFTSSAGGIVPLATPPTDHAAEFDDDDPAFIPVVESADSTFGGSAAREHVQARMYYLPPPVSSADAFGTGPVLPASSAPGVANHQRSTSSTVTYFHPSVAAGLGGRARSAGGQEPSSNWQSDREARHRERFDRAALEARTATAITSTSSSAQGVSASSLAGHGFGIGRSHGPDEGDGGAHATATNDHNDPMLLGPLMEESQQDLPQLPLPPRRHSSWLLSPVLAHPPLPPLSLPIPPPPPLLQQRPQLSVDAAGAFARTARDVTLTKPLSGSTSGGGAGGDQGGNASAISNLFWRGLPSASTPLRSALASAEEAGLRPSGSRIRLWHEDSPPLSSGLHYPTAVDSDDERFEPRAAGTLSTSPIGRGFTSMSTMTMMMTATPTTDEWERFQPRCANQTERTDLTVVEEPELEEPPQAGPSREVRSAEENGSEPAGGTEVIDAAERTPSTAATANNAAAAAAEPRAASSTPSAVGDEAPLGRSEDNAGEEAAAGLAVASSVEAAAQGSGTPELTENKEGEN
ncbi:hypothetical protein JCM3774_004252 [Rhodotorula dairenensis]